MKVSILGCGWFGKSLALELLKKGYEVKGSTTSKTKAEYLLKLGISSFHINIESNSEISRSEFFSCDILIVCIPPKFKSGQKESYLSKIQTLIAFILKNDIKKVVYISSSGVYGDINREVCETDAPQSDSENGLILFEAEKMFKNVSHFKTSIIRFAGLIGPERHPGNFFAGKKDILDGRAPVNLIHLTDCLAISIAIIEKDAFGTIFNACHPDHPEKGQFYKEMSRRADLVIPEFKDNLGKWKIVKSINLYTILNYKFKFQTLQEYSYY